MSSGIRTFDSLREEVLSWLDEAGAASGSATYTNVSNAINQAHYHRLTADLWPFMVWDTAETFSLVASTQLYALHPEFHRPLYFFNRTKKAYLTEVGMRQLGPSGVRWNDDRDQTRFVLWGRSPVAAQPSTASTLRIVSSSASDTTAAKAITVRGLVSNVVQEESFTPNGTTQVTGTLSFSKILSVTKGADWVGTLTLSTSGGSTLLTLLPTEYGRSYQLFYLLSSPSSTDTIEYRFYRMPRKLVSDNDVPDIPPPHADILVWDALLLLAAYDGQLDPMRVQEWGKRQQEMEIALRKAMIEIQPVEADPLFVRPVEEDFDQRGWPHVVLD